MIGLNSKYPILCVAMNQVSDLNLAVAVSLAGAYPSLSLFNYELENEEIDLRSFAKDLEQFKILTKSNEILISMGSKNFLDDRVLNILNNYQTWSVELIEDVNLETIPKINKIKKDFPQIKLFVKVLGRNLLPDVDGIILKGPEGAGRSNSGVESLINMFREAQKLRPDLIIIPSGGIGNSSDVKNYIDQGAKIVGIGTLFAATEESPVSRETKLKIVESSSRDLKRFSTLNQYGLLFKELDIDDENRTNSLKEGINNTDNGHIYVGSSIDNINRIKTVEELVKELVSELTYD